MAEYRKPAILPNQILKLPVEDERIRIIEDANTLDAENEKDWGELQKRFQEIRRDTIEFLGARMGQLSARDDYRIWADKGPLARGLSWRRTPWGRQFRERFDSLEAQEKSAKVKADEAERQRQKDLKPARAVLFLLKHGKIEGQDFTVDTAVFSANELVKEKAIASKMAEGGPFSFSGEDYCEDCGGWDGTSHRCECGNRRVGWETIGDFEDFDDGSYYVYGEAY